MDGNPRISRITTENGYFSGPRFRIFYDKIKPSSNGPEVMTGLMAGIAASFALARTEAFKAFGPAVSAKLATWLGTGGIAHGISVASGFLAPMAVMMGITTLGSAIGGWFNKWEEEGYKKNGRTIGKPSRFNRESFLGLVRGVSLSQIAGLAISGISYLTTGVSLSALGWFMPVVGVIGAIYGAKSGSDQGMQRMQQEYEQAKLLYAVQSGELVQERGQEMSLAVPALAAGAAVAAGVAVGMGADAGGAATAAEFTAHAHQGGWHPAQDRPANYWQDNINAGRGRPQVQQTAQQPQVPPPPRRAVLPADTRQFRQMIQEARVREALQQMKNQRT